MRYAFVLFILSFLSACQERPVAPQPPKETGMTAANVLASIDSTNIYDFELQDQIKKIESKFPRKITTHPQKLSLLNEMINLDLLAEEALKRNIQKRFEFKARLADVLVEDLAEEARSKIQEADVVKLYHENQDALDQVSARHILLSTERKSPAEKKELKAQIEKIRQEVLAQPEKFADVAKQKSQDSSAGNGGELGYFNSTMMVAPFSKAAFALKKIGDISPVVESKYGFHIIQLSGDKRGIDFVREVVRNELVRRAQQAALSKEIERLRKSKKVEVFEKNLAQLSPLPEIVNQDPDKIMKFKPQDEPTPEKK